MSTENINGHACKQRFKGIENFLRRIAFNLGNVYLVSKLNTENADQCLCRQNCSPVKSLLLKQVAFKLGNTPSQTEVKIISCIPIDVTDLQQKVIHLERQLDEARHGPESTTTKSKAFKQRASVNTALCEQRFPRVSTEVSCKSLECDRCTSPTCINTKKKKSNVSFICPVAAANECSSSRPHTPANISSISQYSDKKPTPPTELTDIPKMCDPRPCDHRKNIFKKKKKLIKKKQRSPYVYYAQTNISSPFVRSDLTEELQNTKNDVMNRSYLTKMINKQYRPQVLGDNLSRMSQFSSPICRDTVPNPRASHHYESDACSCCKGPFHNLDSNFPKLASHQIYMVNEMNTGNAYYDTNQYDLVPVREKPVKIKKDYEIPRKKDPKPQIDIKCWPERVQTKKIRYHPLYVPPIVYYQTQHHDYYRSRDENPMRKIPMKVNNLEPVAKKVAKPRREINNKDCLTNCDTSKTCSIDFGTIYPKIDNRKPKVQKSLQSSPVLKKNAECLTTVINNSECQTITSNIEANATDIKTEATLNQIKTILQSVLEEVKVSSHAKNQVEEKEKKDAVVQKGPSQSNIQQESTYMNSITYSPYTMQPNPYMPSCSRQMNPNQLNCFPQSPLKCLQNFPLFIQTPGRHICSNCYRNSSPVKSIYNKLATTTATNTDEFKDRHSNETEKLIKEIYKSMALNMELPRCKGKDTSLSGYDETMRSTNDFRNPVTVRTTMKKPPLKIRNVVQAVSELFMKKDIADTSETLNTTAESKLLPSYDPSTRSHLTTSDTDNRIRKERLEKYMQKVNTQSKPESEKRMYHEGVRHIATTVTASESSTSESETDSTIAVPKEVPEPKQKREKYGLFSKMLQSVKLFKQRERSKKLENLSEAATSSDSDDYQTIYSQKIEKSLNHRNRAYNLPKRKTHSKISYKQTYQRDRSPEKRRSPYMEQEYRRYWNERLMFHDDKRNSSEQPCSSDHTPPRNTYHRSYDARSALVEPRNPFLNIEPRKYRPNNTEYNNKVEKKLTAKGLAWLKKHQMGIHCGEQWKKLILEG